jgi:hypothetical protein
LGISTTVTFFYLGWACIALRAYRVKAVFDTYEQYLTVLYAQDGAGKDDELLFSMISQHGEDLN